MRSLLLTLAAGSAAFLLSGCPDMPAGPGRAHSDAHWQASRLIHARESAAHNPHDSATRNAGVRHKVSEIAWFQGTIDEAFSRRGCPQSHTRRGLFRS
jgi:outer membrane biogenesis lipoprotein LolB